MNGDSSANRLHDRQVGVVTGTLRVLAFWCAIASPLYALDDSACLKCHSAAAYKPEKEGEKPPPFVNPTEIEESIHGQKGVACQHCHTAATEVPHPKGMPKYTCSNCHKAVAKQYQSSIHGKARSEQITEAASCVDCHGAHDMQARTDPRSHTHPKNVKETCLRCHTNEEMARRFNFTRRHIGAEYDQSIHARMISAGHADAATCNDCHGSHNILPSRETLSSVNRANIPKTCGKCHWVVLQQYKESIHGQNFAKGSAQAPVCNNCHRDHQVQPTSSDYSKLAVVSECGNCHQDLLRSYRMSYHGKITQLGGTATARCSDCHGHYHLVFAVNDSRSWVSKGNVVATCRRCHAGANENFAKYYPHADYLDRARFPIIFYAWLAMITLLAGTLSFFTLHTILWFIRSVSDHVRNGRRAGVHSDVGSTRYVQRFSLYNRLTHGLVIISFLGLTLTGFPLKYSYTSWAHSIFHLLGGFRVAGFLHRVFAVMSLAYVIMHLVYLKRIWKQRRKQPFFRMMFGPNSMVLNWNDLKQFFQHVRWSLFWG